MIISYHKSCKGKHQHASQGAAEAHLRALSRRDTNPEKMHAYFCTFCKGYHVGHRHVSQWERTHGTA